MTKIFFTGIFVITFVLAIVLISFLRDRPYHSKDNEKCNALFQKLKNTNVPGDFHFILKKGMYCHNKDSMNRFVSDEYDFKTRIRDGLQKGNIQRNVFSTTFEIDHHGGHMGKHNIFISSAPVLTPSECLEIIQASEEVSKIKGYTSRDAQVTTKDQLVSNLPKSLQNTIHKALKYSVQQYILFTNDTMKFDNTYPDKKSLFVIRYDMEKDGQIECKPHYDTTDMESISVVISLSPETDYEGGGTEFYERPLNSKVARPPIGHAVVFKGSKLYHGGVPIRSGKRFVLVALFETRLNILERMFGKKN